MSIDASGVSLSAGLPCVKPSRTASSLSLQAHRFAPFSHSPLTRPPLHHQSFFGGLTIGRVADPDYTLDQVALVASPPDLLATKLKVLLQRAERKVSGCGHPVELRTGAERWAGGGAGAVWLRVSGP